MSSSRRSILATSGFGRGSLTVTELWVFYGARYHVPLYMKADELLG
jgi:hypothetical protein